MVTRRSENFRGFRVFDFVLYPKLGNLGKFFLTSNFRSSCNLDAKKTKNDINVTVKLRF